MVRGHPAGGTRRVTTAGGTSYACRSRPLRSKHSYRDPAFYDDAKFGTRKGTDDQIRDQRKWMRHANRTAIGVPRSGGGSYGDTIYWSFANRRPGKDVYKLGKVNQDILSQISNGGYKWPRKKRKKRAPKFGPVNRPPPPRPKRNRQRQPSRAPPPRPPPRPPPPPQMRPRTPMGPMASGPMPSRKRAFPPTPVSALPSKRQRFPKFSVPKMAAAGLL